MNRGITHFSEMKKNLLREEFPIEEFVGVVLSDESLGSRVDVIEIHIQGRGRLCQRTTTPISKALVLDFCKIE